MILPGNSTNPCPMPPSSRVPSAWITSSAARRSRNAGMVSAVSSRLRIRSPKCLTVCISNARSRSPACLTARCNCATGVGGSSNHNTRKSGSGACKPAPACTGCGPLGPISSCRTYRKLPSSRRPLARSRDDCTAPIRQPAPMPENNRCTDTSRQPTAHASASILVKRGMSCNGRVRDRDREMEPIETRHTYRKTRESNHLAPADARTPAVRRQRETCRDGNSADTGGRTRRIQDT